MEQPKEPTLDEQVASIHTDIVALAKRLKISSKEALMLLMQRELVILNTELRRVHEMFDMYGKKAKVKGR